MQLTTFLSKWTQVAGLLLVAGALAWAIKLGVIVSTNGRIIDTGAAAFLMATGMILLVVGSTGIGNYLTQNRPLFVRIIAILLSPALVFGSFIIFGMFTNPLFKNSSIAYAQQEAPIAVAVIVYFVVGIILYNKAKRVKQYV